MLHLENWLTAAALAAASVDEVTARTDSTPCWQSWSKSICCLRAATLCGNTDLRVERSIGQVGGFGHLGRVDPICKIYQSMAFFFFPVKINIGFRAWDGG